MGTLTRSEMETVIREGGSVLHNGFIHSSIATLPAEADLARGDETRLSLVEQSLDEQIATAQAEKNRIAGMRKVAKDGDQNRERIADANADRVAASESAARAAGLPGNAGATIVEGPDASNPDPAGDVERSQAAFRDEVAAREGVFSEATDAAAKERAKQEEAAAASVAKVKEHDERLASSHAANEEQKAREDAAKKGQK